MIRKWWLLGLLLILSRPCFSADINVWKDQGIVIADVAGNKPGQPNALNESGCVIISSPCFKMWYGVTTGINYAESSNATTWSQYSGNPVISIASRQFPRVFKNGSTYYLYTGPAAGPVAAYTSSNGTTWSLQNATALARSQSWELTGGFFGQICIAGIDSGTWYGYYTAENVNNANNYAMGLATSSDGINWTKSVSNPAITAGQPSNFWFQKVGSNYYGWSQIVQAGIPNFGSLSIPSDISRYQSGSLTGPWNLLSTSTFYRTLANEGVGTKLGQVADPTFVEANGNVYMFFTIATDGTGVVYNISCAIAFSTTLAQLVTGREGVFDIPIPTTAGLALQSTTLASDTFHRANANPAAGNWTQISSSGGFTSTQISSNLMLPSGNNTVRGGAYWNAVVWPADQWASVTLQANNGASATNGVILRGSTSGAATCYTVSVINTLGGSSNSIRIDKFVAGAFTPVKQSATTYTFSSGDVLVASIVGTTISAYINGNLIVTTTDSSIASGAAGINLYAPSTNTDSEASAWSGGSLQNAATLLGSRNVTAPYTTP